MRARPSARLAALHGLGELLITVGTLALIFVFWQLVWTDVAAASTQRSTLSELEQRWSTELKASPVPSPRGPSDGRAEGRPAEPSPATAPVLAEPPEGDAFAAVHVPRFGRGWVVGAAQGVDLEETLNRGVLGH